MIDKKESLARVAEYQKWHNFGMVGEKPNLRGANLRGAYLRDAYLYGAYLRGANLRGADLYGAKGIYELDMADPRGHRPVAVAYADGWRIASGCRWFTVQEALAHWSERDHEYAARYIRAINALPECPKVGGKSDD